MKRGLEFSFAWIFAILVGGIIIFLALYTTTKFVETSRSEIDTESAAYLDILLNPLSTDIGSSRVAVINMPEENEIEVRCNELGKFGQQTIKTSTGGEGVGASSSNKYLFLSNIDEKSFNVFSQSFYLPYRVGDIIVAYQDSYCFVDAPNKIKDEITQIQLPLIEFKDDVKECVRGSVSVCFESSDCEIKVSADTFKDQGTVVKDNKRVTYIDELIYPAIFSDSELYECQVKRLMKRAASLAELYKSKENILVGRGCMTNLNSELTTFSAIGGIKDSSSLPEIAAMADSIEQKNEILRCKLF